MKILAVGGGSGGHVTPVVAVFKEILKRNRKAELRFWCDKKFLPQAKKTMVSAFGEKVKVGVISSGKFRRYTHLTFLQHLAIPSIFWGNFFDIFKNIAGVFQAFFKLIIWRPDVIFCKGGFVCVPAGLAAWALRIPVIIHDSDAHPGLANRILSRFAKKIATGAPLEFYKYPREISKYVGIPIVENFKKYSDAEKSNFKRELGFSDKKPLVVITGGGLGAARINNAIVVEAEKLSRKSQILLISGAGQFDELLSKISKTKEQSKIVSENFYLEGFISKDMWKYLAAADLVVARAGATSNLELAALAKPTILVPNARLTGGHQMKNAQVYKKSNAVEIVSDDEIENSPEILSNKILELLDDSQKTSKMSQEFSKFAKPNAAKDVADMILSFKK